ncbi:MAG: hypothetical protein CPSOU_1711 [uncultured Paraburkholderia sp.]|nr:MAG: hypothetical protein CPSOU_1711 [uncultured Paraburkholderia sp.]
MRAVQKLADPWVGTVRLLGGEAKRSTAGGCSPAPARWAARITSVRPDASSETLTTTISAIDRLTDCTVTIAWSDATRGAYGSQVWRRMRARCAGRCASSGAAIVHGDLVYSPRLSRPPSANADAMILASVIDALALESD